MEHESDRRKVTPIDVAKVRSALKMKTPATKSGSAEHIGRQWFASLLDVK
jgi:hypothetical protein